MKKTLIKKSGIMVIAMLLVLTQIVFLNSQSTGFNAVSSSSGFNSVSSSSSFSGSAYGSNSFSGGGYYGGSINPQFNNPGFYSGPGFISPDVYWPKFNQNDCFERADFIMQIAPGGCTPAVVRSDLLEEQNVPVFCKVMAITVNPLIDSSRIRSMYFTGNYPSGISGISYFPARAALRSQQSLISTPIQDNLGYVVIVLARQNAERDMPEYIGGNITATIDYDVEGAFGTGNTNFYINEMSDEEWRRDYRQYGFWNGKGYIRADSIEPDRITVSVYKDADSRMYTLNLMKGETSRDIYLNGFYCAAGLNLRLEKIEAPVDSALLQINDQQIWVSRGDRVMNNKCTVNSLDAYSGGGKISINCPVKNGKVELSLNAGRANLSVSKGEFKQYSIGDTVNGSNSFLGYIGEDSKGNSFVVSIIDEFSVSANEFSDKEVFNTVESIISKSSYDINDDKLKKEIINAIKKQYKTKLQGLSAKGVEDKIIVCISTREKPDCNIIIGDIMTAKDRTWDFTKEEEKTAKEYYDWAIKYYEDLASLYPNEKMLQGSTEESYAAIGLYEAAILSRSYGMNGRAQDYLNRLTRDYPNSYLANKIVRDMELLTKYGSSNSRASVSIGTEQYFVELLDFKKPTRAEAGATLLINGKEINVGLNEIVNLESFNKSSKNIQLTEINDEYVSIKYSKSGIETLATGTSQKTERINLQSQTEIDGVRIKLLNVNLKKQAKIGISPKMYGPRAEANFSFKIGIEKRAIKLSPEQTKDMIENLKKTIKDWENINNKLGNVVSGMKAACFATSAMLTVKNLLSGWSGESMARKDIMTKSGGWNEYCEKLVNDKTTSGMNGKSYADLSVEKCLLDHDSYIKKDIEIYKNEIEKTNEIMKKIQEGIGIEKTDILDMSGQVDARKAEDMFKEKFMEFCKNQNGEITLPDAEQNKITFSENGICSWDTLTHEQRKEIMTLYNAKNEISSSGGSSVLQDMVNKELGRATLDAKNYWENEGARRKNELERKQNNMGVRAIVPGGDKVTLGDIKTITKGDSDHQVYGNYKEGQSVVLINVPFKESFSGAEFNAEPEVAGKQVTVPIIKQPGGDYTIDPNGVIYIINGQVVSENGSISVKKYMGLKGLTRFKESNAKAYQNKMIGTENMLVKYFERAPYKGLPAEVPFDVENGWYVEMTYVLSGFGKPYDESGRVVNFWICNVGPNGMIDFKKSLDDICRYYNGETGADLGFGIEPSEERNLIMRAQQAIYDAAKQYGKERVVIAGQSFKSGISFGGEEGRCSDFMSPFDCNILFNVCDPVMCPSSRCDLGGDFRVDNVVQTGVIGSLMLCLPNAKEGIMVPICLSGVHAGIEGYISIMNSTIACLNESLTTGRNIGICDEIKSIYLCEFFWKQATPLINVIIPRIVESLYSQGVRGGGEYLTVQSAWDNMRESIDYFRNDYAVNSMVAFQARSTEEIGGEVCKSFMSVRYPDSKDFFDRLIEPDSPIQYHAWFSEDQYTTATIPATSHYKVYYHIYAGKDQGAYYTVYMKDLPETSYIYMNQMYIIDRGYIERGSQIDQAKDFTAVSGYKQLCVNINGKDECGFGKVTSSYLINSIADSYAESQIITGIKNSKECVAGTPSLISAVNPSLQAGAQEIIEPAIYNHGIIRVCSSENPGKRILPSGEFDTTNSTFDKWKEVGYCDDPTIKCWLDTSSVKDVIQNKQIEEDVLKEVDLNVLGEIDYWTPENSLAVASQAEKDTEALIISQSDSKDNIEKKISPIASKLNDLTKLGPENKYRARGLYLLARLYRKVSQAILQNNQIGTVTITPSPTPNPTPTPTPSPSPSDIIVWKDEMLKENAKIEVQNYGLTGGFISSITYMYNSKQGWISKNTEFNNLKLGYVEGIKKLVSNSGTNDKIIVDNAATTNKLFEGDSKMSEEIFTLLKKSEDSLEITPEAIPDTINETDVYSPLILQIKESGIFGSLAYFRYNENWEWALKTDDWTSAEIPKNILNEKSISSKLDFLRINLIKKNCDDGLKYLVAQAIKNKYTITVYFEGNSKKLEFESAEKTTCENLKK